ncbi:hypothetical protein Forpe1208_v008297 [Fusarium oxysporum f. sp. rapae]|uniref:Metallo-beta-lactamase domain-containing protein n=1 Tax=Fusarium oxysporum f. sp. rapae TaxID=485398 RepID=A0A8J5UAG7_FUSOX|nr:hypothetical protein Forpe1208_v008297 [Fusarium oxysporum f. sp. rapae]
MVALAASKTVPLHPPTADTLISQALAALGGEKAIAGIDGITYHSPNVYHSRSLIQSYNMDKADTAVAISGSQNVSFSYSSGQLTQRIDRTVKPNEYWYWSSARLDEFDYPLVVRGGKDGFACYMKAHRGTKATEVLINGINTPAVYDPILEITIIFDDSSHLHRITRTEENHMVYGPSTNDLYFSQYKAVEGIKFPYTFQTVYNSTTQKLDATLEEFIVEEITINPKFPKNYFKGLSEGKGFFPKEVPKKTEGLSHAHILEFSSNMLWSGPGSGINNNSVDSIKHKNIVPGLPNAHWLVVDDEFLGVKQFVIELENHVVVGDASPQWTKQVIEWIDKNIGKSIKYLWPTHHHRVHNGGVAEYVKIGAKLIIPEIASSYWSSIPGVELITLTKRHPYIHSDSKHQAWFIWEEQATHSIDWSYAFFTDKGPTNKSGIAVIEADAWHPGMPDAKNDRWEMREWLGQLDKDGLPESA